MKQQKVAMDDETFMRQFGLRLRYLRNARGIPPKEFAARVGISFQMWWKYENGMATVNFRRLPAIASAFGLPTIGALFDMNIVDHAPSLVVRGGEADATPSPPLVTSDCKRLMLAAECAALPEPVQSALAALVHSLTPP